MAILCPILDVQSLLFIVESPLQNFQLMLPPDPSHLPSYQKYALTPWGPVGPQGESCSGF